VLLDGTKFIHDEEPNGNFMGPTIIEVNANLRNSNPAYSEELFGPVLTIMRVDTYDQAMEILNQNRFGNGACIFTTSGFYQRDFSIRANPGQIGINVPIPVPLPMFSFSGNKGSEVINLI
jgi:malonate-semialdehyde dehydrogenase (acetylating)/methylmalonate-semialdehyde dehydrogenase